MEKYRKFHLLRKNMKKNSSLVRNLKIDMTPLVDISFILLLSFFVVDFYKRKNFLILNMPIKVEASQKRPNGCMFENNTMTILMGKNEDIFIYLSSRQLGSNNVEKTNLSHLAQEIVNHKALAIDTSKFTITLKPSEFSKYGAVVGVLSNFKRKRVERYAIVDLSEMDKIFLKSNYRIDEMNENEALLLAELK